MSLDPAPQQVPRSALIAVDAPPVSSQPVQFGSERVFLITDDGRGVAQAVAEQVRDRGGRVVLVRYRMFCIRSDGGVSAVEQGSMKRT